jgi:hypothetical protein
MSGCKLTLIREVKMKYILMMAIVMVSLVGCRHIHHHDGPGNSENAPGHNKHGDGPGNSENAPGQNK